MKNKNIFSEKFLIWKNGPEVATTSGDSLERARAQYFELREYLRTNYRDLDDRIAQKMADDPGNEYYPRVKERLDQIVFDDRFDANTISREDLKLVSKSVLSGDLEFFHGELATLARGMVIKDINESLAGVASSWSEDPGVVDERGSMVKPRVEIESRDDTGLTIRNEYHPTTGRLLKVVVRSNQN